MHDYQPWAGELAVQPVPCPCCGSPAKVWQYVEKPGADVLRVVMCDGGAFQEERLPMLLDVCLLDMPPDAFYCQTARQAVAVWNLYAESLNTRRAAIAGAAPQPVAVPTERLVRFCPGCGSVGEVEPQFRDCCPDGGHARMVPESLAHRCRDLFQLALDGALRTSQPASEIVRHEGGERAPGP